MSLWFGSLADRALIHCLSNLSGAGTIGYMNRAYAKNYGFTIVELLIVIVVIAVLATLSYVGYVGMSNRAYDAVVEQDLASIKKSLEVLKVDLGHYPVSLGEFPRDLKISRDAYDQSQNNVYYYSVGDAYALGVRSKSTKTVRGFILTNEVLLEGVPVNGSYTAAEIGTTPGTALLGIQCYSASTESWTSWCPL